MIMSGVLAKHISSVASAHALELDLHSLYACVWQHIAGDAAQRSMREARFVLRQAERLAASQPLLSLVLSTHLCCRSNVPN
jgi:hypothetical protein